MSTLVVVRKGDEVCLAGDTLTIYDGMKEFAGFLADQDKILRLGRTWIGMAGPLVTRQALGHLLRQKHTKRGFHDVHMAFETVQELHQKLAELGYTPEAMVVATNRSIFRADEDGGVVELNRFDAVGTGRAYALGALHAVYDALPRAEMIATAGVEAAARFDLYTELPMTRFTMRLERGGEEGRSKRKKGRKGGGRPEAAEARSQKAAPAREEPAAKAPEPAPSPSTQPAAPKAPEAAPTPVEAGTPATPAPPAGPSET